MVWFIDKNGNIIACSTEYRKEMINQNVSFRKYFKDSIQGKLSIFIARGIYTKRDDIRISYPVYDRGNIIGVLVLQFDISKNFKKEIDIENAFMMHSSGGILIGKQELKNRMLFSVSPEELKKVYEEKYSEMIDSCLQVLKRLIMTYLKILRDVDGRLLSMRLLMIGGLQVF